MDRLIIRCMTLVCIDNIVLGIVGNISILAHRVKQSHLVSVLTKANEK